MIAPKLVDSCKVNGQLLSITLQIREEKEKEIFKKFFASENIVCSNCGATNLITDEDYTLIVDNPLSGSVLSAATPTLRCDNCGKHFNLSMVDYNAFPSIVAYLAALRKRYMELRQNGKK